MAWVGDLWGLEGEDLWGAAGVGNSRTAESGECGGKKPGSQHSLIAEALVCKLETDCGERLQCVECMCRVGGGNCFRRFTLVSLVQKLGSDN